MYVRLLLRTGPYDPELCRYLYPSTLRAKLGNDVPRNALHCTDLAEDAALECSYFFQLMATHNRSAPHKAPFAPNNATLV